MDAIVTELCLCFELFDPTHAQDLWEVELSFFLLSFYALFLFCVVNRFVQSQGFQGIDLFFLGGGTFRLAQITVRAFLAATLFFFFRPVCSGNFSQKSLGDARIAKRKLGGLFRGNLGPSSGNLGPSH